MNGKPSVMQNILSQLKRLDLEKYPTKQIEDLFDEFIPIPIIVQSFHKGKEIERAVNNPSFESFSNKSRISYKPQRFNNSYQRASTPEMTMFYGIVIPEEVGDKEIEHARIIGSYEACELLRDDLEGGTIMTFGKWKVIKDISLVVILNPFKKYSIKMMEEQRMEILDGFKRYDFFGYMEKLSLLAFIADEFSKKHSGKKDSDYLITALLTKKIIEQGYDGVLYPSVQASEKGICVSIKPKSIRKKMRLNKVLECRLIKHNNQTKLQNTKVCVDIDIAGDLFELTSIL